MAYQVPAMAGSDHLRGGRQVLVHHPFHQITEVLERHAAARTRQPLITTRQKAALHSAGVRQIDIPRLALVALHRNMAAGGAAQENQVFIAAAAEVGVFHVAVAQQGGIARFYMGHWLVKHLKADTITIVLAYIFV